LARAIFSEKRVEFSRIESGGEVVKRGKSGEELAYAIEHNCWLLICFV
jgi:hypothetical protein